ncbi:MAG: efflux RND transporter periplasmic adaptor subunit [Microcoleaceae cyanobacterium]
MDNQQAVSRQLLFLFLSTLLGACAAQPQAATPPPVAVVIGRVESTDVKDSTIYNARVEGVDNAVIRPRVEGIVKQVYVSLGDSIEEGEPLLLIDPAQQQANLASRLATVESRRSQVEVARAELAGAEAELKRTQAELEFQSQGANLDQSQQGVAAQKQEEERLRFELENAKKTLQAQRQELVRRQAIQTERQASFSRYDELYQEGVVSREVYDERLRDRETSEADVATQAERVRAAESSVESARRGLARQGSNIAGAQAGVKSAENDLARQVTTLEAQLERQKRNIQAGQARIDSLQREIQGAQADAVGQQVQLEFYNVIAPINGIVGNVPVKVGDLVNSQTEVTSIRSNTQLEVNIEIPVEKLAQVRVGTPVEIISQDTGGSVGTSRVSYIAPSAGQTQTILVKAIYDNTDGQLRTDQIVRARVIWQQKPGLTVPTTAVSRIGGQSFVFVVEEDNTEGQQREVARQRPVQLGSIQGQSYAVISGITAGDRIVTDGIVKLRDGLAVTDQSPLQPGESSQQSP